MCSQIGMPAPSNCVRTVGFHALGYGVAEVCEATHGCSLDTDFRPGRAESWLGSLLGRRAPTEPSRRGGLTTAPLPPDTTTIAQRP
jgi:hypothetical protein